MAFDAHKNAAYSLVATAPSPATSGTTLVVTAGEGARFPATPFNAVIWAAGAQPAFTAGGTTGGNFEIVRVTGRSTDTLTITRAQESTTARTVVVGDQIAATVTAKTLTDVETAPLESFGAATDVTTLNATTSAHGLMPKLGGGTTNYFRADGTFATPPAAGSASGDLSGTYPSPVVAAIQGHPVSVAVKATDQTLNTQTTLQNDTALLFAIGASATEVWWVELTLLVVAANVTMDIKAGWTGPTAATAAWGALNTPNSILSSFGPIAPASTPGALKTIAQTDSYGTGTVGNVTGIQLGGFFYGGGNAGNVTFQWAQNTSDGGALTVKAASWLQATKLVS